MLRLLTAQRGLDTNVSGPSRLGGVVEATGYNSRLQPTSRSITSGTLTFLNLAYGFYDGSGHNNGNVMSIADQLNAGRTQTFTYDALNRLQTAQSQATSGPDC